MTVKPNPKESGAGVEEKTMEFMKLAKEVKQWFDERDIDTGYTDTNVGHFALFIQKAVKAGKLEVLRELFKEIENKPCPRHQKVCMCRLDTLDLINQKIQSLEGK